MSSSFDDQLADLYDDESINKLRLLLIVCGGAVACLWHTPQRYPALADEVERLTGLTAKRVDEIVHLREPHDVVRFVGLRTAEFHALLTLGLALLDSPLTVPYHAHMRSSPQEMAGELRWDESCAMVREAAADLIKLLERESDADTADEEAEEPTDAGDETADAADTGVLLPNGGDLQLLRLQLTGLVTRALAEALPPATDDQLEDAPADEDPDHPDHEYYHQPHLEVEFNQAQLHVLRLALSIPYTLFTFPELPLGSALRQLRWASRRTAIQRIIGRLDAQTPDEPMRLSLAEVLIFSQAVQVAALGGIRNVVGEINARLRALGVEESPEQAHAEQFFAGDTANSQRVRPLFFESIAAFTQMLREGLADDEEESTELADAQAEIDALTSLL